MAKKTQAQIEFTAETKAFREGIADANKSIRNFKDELKLNDAQLKNDAYNVDLLTDRKKLLEQQTEESERKIRLLRETLAQAQKTFGDNSAETEKLTRQLRNAQIEYENIQSEVKKTDNRYEELKKASERLGVEMKDVGSEAEKSGRSLKDLGQDAENAGDGFTVAKGAIASFIGNGLTALTSAIGSGVSSLASLSDETQEYREDIGKLETAWESAGKSTELATETYKNFYSVLGEEDRSVEAVNHLAKFVDTEKDMQKWTEICTGVWGTFGDSLPVEGLTEASNETAKVGKVTGVLADALNWAGVNEDAFQTSLDKCNNESERAKLITETLNGLYSEASDHYKENNESIIEARKAQSDYTDTLADLGEKIEPLMTGIKGGLAEVIGAFATLVEDVDFVALGEDIRGAFSDFTENTLPKIKDGLQWIVDNKDILIAGITGIGTAFVAFKVVGIIQGIVTALQGMTIAQAALNVVMSMNPIGLVVAGIAGLVAMLVVLWNKSDAFRNSILGLWEGLKATFLSIAPWMNANVIQPTLAFFKGLWQGIQAVWNGIVLGVSTFIRLVASIFSAGFQIITLPFQFIWQNCKEYVFQAIDWMKNKVNTGMQLLKQYLINPISQAYTNLMGKFASLRDGAVSRITDLRNKASSLFNSLKEKVTTPINNAKNTAVNAFASLRDSVVSRISSLRDSVSSIFSTIRSKMTAPVEKARDTIKGIVDRIKGFFNFTVPTPNIKLPRFSISPSGWKLKDLLQGSVPKLSITWNKDGAIFTSPTIFNTNKGLQGAGEAGAEAILPLERLEQWVNHSMHTATHNAVNASTERIERLIDVAEQILAKDTSLYVNGQRMSQALGSSTDSVSGERISLAKRGVVVG